MLKSFIRTLADALSYHAMNESTELHVYSEDGILKIVLAQDDCENTGVVMNTTAYGGQFHRAHFRLKKGSRKF